jgi:hypothetical protein
MAWVLALLLNAIPLYGVLVHGWSVGSLMLLLAIEFTLQAVAMGLRVRRHERHSGDPFYLDPDKRPTYLSNGHRRSYASHAAAFSSWYMASFVILVLLGLAPIAFANRWTGQEASWLPDLSAVAWSALAVAITIAVGLAVEWRSLPRRSVASIHEQTEQLRYRAISIALTVLIGAPAVSKLASPYAWLAVQLLCKTTFDLWLATQSGFEPAERSGEPPLSERLYGRRARLAARSQERPPSE